jgi:hypothetical protein
VQNLVSSSMLSKNLQIWIYRTIIFLVVYGCETWSLTLREERRMTVLEKRVLRRIFGPKKDDVTGEWRKLHNEELYDLYISQNIIFFLSFFLSFVKMCHSKSIHSQIFFIRIICTLCLLSVYLIFYISHIRFLKNSRTCTFLHQCFSCLLSLSFISTDPELCHILQTSVRF